MRWFEIGFLKSGWIWCSVLFLITSKWFQLRSWQTLIRPPSPYSLYFILVLSIFSKTMLNLLWIFFSFLFCFVFFFSYFASKGSHVIGLWSHHISINGASMMKLMLLGRGIQARPDFKNIGAKYPFSQWSRLEPRFFISCTGLLTIIWENHH